MIAIGITSRGNHIRRLNVLVHHKGHILVHRLELWQLKFLASFVVADARQRNIVKNHLKRNHPLFNSKHFGNCRMQFAEIGNHVFTQAESPAASGMIISRSVQTDLGILKRAIGCGDCGQSISLGVKHVISPLLAKPTFFRSHTGTNAAGNQILLPGFTAVKSRPDLKQRNIGITAGNIVLQSQQQIGQNRRTHLIQFRRNRIIQLNRFPAVAENFCQLGICKTPSHGFQHSADCQFMLYRNHTTLRRGQHLFRKLVMRQRNCRNIVQTNHPDNFLNQVMLTLNITAPGRRYCFNFPVFFGSCKTKLIQYLHNFFFGDVHAGKVFHPRRTNISNPGLAVFAAGNHNFRSLTAANIQNHLRGIIRP